jgi:chromosome segregation protein
VSEGGKALLSERDSLPGLVGVVADVLEVPPAYLDALEASLGEAASFVLVEDRAVIEPAIERLRRPEGGRATLVDLSAQAAVTLPEIPTGPGIIGRASKLVKCEARFRALADRLLGAVMVVESRDLAQSLAQESPAACGS